MLNIKPISLKGSWVQLELLNESHKTELYDAAQDELIWMYSSSKALGAKFYDWFDKALLASKQQQQLPFVVKRLIDRKIIGSTRYYDIEPKHHRLSIGYTWYVPTVWGSYVNPECKLLLLTFAFEELQVNRVQFTTDSRNFHSRLAIKKLGAT